MMVGRTDGSRDASGSSQLVTEVEIAAVLDGGELETLAVAQVAADGSWSAAVEPDRERIVVLGTTGAEVTHRALVASTGEANDVVFCPPLTSETDLEAKVFMEVVADGRPVDETDPVDVRARIDDVTASVFSGLDASAKVDALAEMAAAVDAAQQTETDGAAAFGLVIDQEDRFMATIDAAQHLDARLYSGDDRDAADADFQVLVDEALRAEGIDSSLRSRLGAWSGSAWRLALNAGSASPLLVDAATVASAEMEARWTVDAVVDAALRADADSDTLALVNGTCDALVVSVNDAGDAQAAADAFAEFEAAMVGTSAPFDSVVAQVEGLDPLEIAGASSAFVAAAQAAVDLESALAASAEAAARGGSELDASALSMGCVDAWTTYRDTLDTLVATTDAFEQTEATTELVVEATGSFRAVQ